jgi:hypothetical protein
MVTDYFLQKTLTENDVGLTGSHQAGVHVPHGLAGFFPQLDEGTHNPSTWVTVSDDTDHVWQWRWIYYNGRVLGLGTRNEYRATHTVAFLRQEGARAGDILELRRTGTDKYRATVRSRAQSGILVLSTAGTWRSIRLP